MFHLLFRETLLLLRGWDCIWCTFRLFAVTNLNWKICVVESFGLLLCHRLTSVYATVCNFSCNERYPRRIFFDTLRAKERKFISRIIKFVNVQDIIYSTIFYGKEMNFRNRKIEAHLLLSRWMRFWLIVSFCGKYVSMKCNCKLNECILLDRNYNY